MQASFSKHQILLLVLASTIFFTNLGRPKLWDRDEPRNARCAVEMMERHDFIVPTFNGELRTHKPILIYWLMISAYSVFGINEFAARFWSAALAVGTVFLTYSIGRRLLNPRAGVWAAVILSTTFMFNVAARAATPDSALIFCMTLALAIYVRTSFPDANGDATWFRRHTLATQATRYGGYYPRKSFAIPLYAAMGMAVLAKGPIGIVLPTAIIGLFLAITRCTDESPTTVSRNPIGRFMISLVRPLSPIHLLKTAWSMRPLTALTSALAVALPWYLLVGIETEGKWIESFFMEHNIGRASSAMEGHAGSTLFYYPIAILIGFFPWSILTVPICFDVLDVLRRQNRWSASYLFLLCWIGVFVLVFSVAQTKLPSYVTPAYPAVAIIAAGCIERLVSRRSKVDARWFKAAAASLFAVGAVGTVAIAYAARVFLPGEELLALIGLIPLTLGFVAFAFCHYQRRNQFALTIAVAAISLMLCVFGFAAPRISDRQQIVALLHPTIQTTQLASYSVHEPSWVFYADKEVPHLTSECESQAITFLDQSDAALITTSAEFERLRPRLPAGVSKLAEAEYFLKGETLVLIGQPRDIVAADQDNRTARHR